MFRFMKKNKGSALLLVISTMAILSVVGSLLLVKTANNRKMKDAEKKAQETFNSAENGSLELVSALEMISQDAVKKAFSDIMMQYGTLANNNTRMQRFNSVFVGVLQNELTQSDAAEKLLKKALNLSPSDDLDLAVSFGSIETATDTVGESNAKTNKITIKDAKFTYKDAKGNETTIQTDISVVADIPNVKKGMAAGTAAAFEDFILITNGNASNTRTTSEVTKLQGNVYVAKDWTQSNANTIELKEADKLLVKGKIDLSKGAVFKFNNSSSFMAAGQGLWAGNIGVDSGSDLSIDANCYVKDDLSLAGTNTKVVISGNEYLGYSGESTRVSEKSSAITINTAQNITLDLSGLKTLSLRGSSYIQDTIWGNVPSLNAAEKTANLLGVLQGESLAFKDMQAMYLVPSECSFNGKNPMLKSEYDSVADRTISLNYFFHNDTTGEDGSLDLSRYVNPSNPYVTRFVRLDGGSTEYVYLYLNFLDESAAAQYNKDYLSTWKGALIKEQMKQLGSGSKIVLAEKNYTISNLVEYNKNGDQKVTSVAANSANLVLVRNKSRNAEREYSGLFYSLDPTVTKVIPADYDLIRTSVLLPEALGSGDKSVTSGSYNFFLYDRSIATSSVSGISGKKGILIVNGDLTFNSTNFTFDGLIIVTGNVIFNSEAKLTSNEAAVRALLDVPEVAACFRGQGTTGTSDSNGNYISSESVKISFENWNKN